MDADILQDLGFTSAEAKVYLLLLELGSVKVGRVIEKSGLQSSSVHNTLNSLIDKGYVTYILESKIKLYWAVNPKNILKSFQEKERRFAGILPTLEKKADAEKPKAEIFEGTQGIMTLLNELIADAKQRDTYRFFAVDETECNEEIQKFFIMYDAKRKDKKLLVRGLARKELRPLFSKRRYLNVRYVSHAIPSNISLCNDKIAIICWGSEPTGILITSKKLCRTQEDFFDLLWKTAR